MKKRFYFLGLVIVGGIAWSLYPPEYDRLMSEALKKQQEHPEIKIFDGEIEPQMPNREENDKTCLGVDTNNNGIRDDIDIWINRTALDYNERMAMRQYARAKQEELRACSLNLRNELSRVITDTMNANYCLFLISDYKNIKNISNHIDKKINELTISTKQRMLCKKFYSYAPYSSESVDLRDDFEHCKFEIKNILDLKHNFNNSKEHQQ